MTWERLNREIGNSIIVPGGDKMEGEEADVAAAEKPKEVKEENDDSPSLLIMDCDISCVSMSSISSFLAELEKDVKSNPLYTSNSFTEEFSPWDVLAHSKSRPETYPTFNDISMMTLGRLKIARFEDMEITLSKTSSRELIKIAILVKTQRIPSEVGNFLITALVKKDHPELSIEARTLVAIGILSWLMNHTEKLFTFLTSYSVLPPEIIAFLYKYVSENKL